MSYEYVQHPERCPHATIAPLEHYGHITGELMCYDCFELMGDDPDAPPECTVEDCWCRVPYERRNEWHSRQPWGAVGMTWDDEKGGWV